MTKEPKKTYDVSEALERFAKPDIKQRLAKLKPYADNYHADDEKKHDDYMALAFENSNYLVAQLVAGTLSSRDYVEGDDHSEPKRLIDAGKWQGVDIDPRTGSISDDNGPVFPTVEIWDPAEEEEGDPSLDKIQQNGLPLNRLCFHVHADENRVLFDFGIELQGAANKLFRCLYDLHCQELKRSVPPEQFGAVSNAEISEKLDIAPETVPPTVKRTREELSRQFTAAGMPCDSEDIIETKRTTGYRLNPNLQPVALHQLKPKEA